MIDELRQAFQQSQMQFVRNPDGHLIDQLLKGGYSVIVVEQEVGCRVTDALLGYQTRLIASFCSRRLAIDTFDDHFPGEDYGLLHPSCEDDETSCPVSGHVVNADGSRFTHPAPSPAVSTETPSDEVPF